MTDDAYSIRALLARTQFANDGPAMRRSLAVYENHQLAVVQHTTQATFNTINRASYLVSGARVHAPAAAPQAPVVLDRSELARVSDRGPFLDHMRPLLREYCLYTFDHADVYNAGVGLFGGRRMWAGAGGSDALGFLVMAAVVFTFAEGMGCEGWVGGEMRERGRVLASLVSMKKEYVGKVVGGIMADEGQVRLYRGCYMLLMETEDKVSSMLTFCMMSLMESLLGFQGIVPKAFDEYLEFVGKVKGVPESETERYEVSTRGRIIYKGRVYRVSGYCMDGVILSAEGEGVEGEEYGVSQFNGAFFRVFEKYNVKNDSTLCIGCMLAPCSEAGGRLKWYKSALSCADVTTARDIRVGVDGRVRFLAERMVMDERTGAVLRTGMREHECDVYDLHMVGGLDLERCENLSGLFEVGEVRVPGNVQCDGVAVWAIVERMDSYESGENGMIRSITHGGSTKYATEEGGVRRWKEERTAGSEFTIDDIVM